MHRQFLYVRRSKVESRRLDALRARVAQSPHLVHRVSGRASAKPFFHRLTLRPCCAVYRHLYWGEYPLTFAACLSQVDCFRMLNAYGADPNWQDTNVGELRAAVFRFYANFRETPFCTFARYTKIGFVIALYACNVLRSPCAAGNVRIGAQMRRSSSRAKSPSSHAAHTRRASREKECKANGQI